MESSEILVDYRGQILDKVSKVQETAAPFSEEAHTGEILTEIRAIATSKLSDLKPQIMVYGIYNAGKSSIINELIQEDRAMVADRPTTDHVDYYDWNGYRIADTPGVGAPTEHEKITREHLRQADVVLFVMSTTGSNERRQNYERMKEIADAGKKIIIVLNDKDGKLGVDDDVIPIVSQKVQQNMRSVGLDPTQYTIVPVNAKRARKGRIEGKRTFYDRSNMAELEKNILFELRRTSSFHIMRNAIQEIEQSLEQLIRAVAEGATDDLGKFRRMLDVLRERRKLLREHMREYIIGKTGRLGKELPPIVWAHKDDTDKERMNAEVKERIENIAHAVEGELQGQLHTVFEDIEGDLTDLVAQMKTMQAELRSELGIRDLSVDGAEFVRTEENAAALEKLAVATNMLNAAETFLTSSVGKGVAEAVAATAAKTSIGKAVLGMLPKSVVLPPILGPVSIALTVISVIRSFMKDSGKELMERAAQETERNRRRAEMEAQAREELQQKCFFVAEDIAEQLTRSASDAIGTNFGKIEDGFREALSAGEEKSAERTRVCTELGQIAGELDALKGELTVYS